MVWRWCRARTPPKRSRRPKSWTTRNTPCCPSSRSSNPSRRPSPNSAGSERHPRSDGPHPQHGVGVGREGVAQAARLGGEGTLHGGHRGLIELVLRCYVGTGDFGDGHGAGELLVLEVEIGGEGLVGVAVDGVDDQPAVVECGGTVQVRHLVEAAGLVFWG